jgi:hypothetical protein
VIAAAEPVYKRLGAAEKLRAVHPDAAHDWPEAQRAEAYEFMDKWLKP